LARLLAVHPIATVQSQLSLWSRDQEPVEQACAELGVAFVAYRPLGRGLLASAVRTESDLAADDFRRTLPRFQGENLARNEQLAGRLDALAASRGASPAQVALAWLLAKGRHVIPIPGTRRLARIEENAAATEVALTVAEIVELDDMARDVAGGRYPAWVTQRAAEQRP
jgi:aryl-alcohol dehydrogenase-like predicted oxidoreductase